MVQIKPTCKAENRDSDVKNRGTDAKKGARRKEGLGWMGGGTDMCTPLMLCMNRQLLGTCCMTQGALLNVLRVPKPEGNLRKKKYMHTCSRCTLLHSRNTIL